MLAPPLNRNSTLSRVVATARPFWRRHPLLPPLSANSRRGTETYPLEMLKKANFRRGDYMNYRRHRLLIRR